MADVVTENENVQRTTAPGDQLESSTYEIIQNRLRHSSQAMRERVEKLNDARRDVFGSIETRLLSTERITTDNNCVPRDMVAIGNRFIFGFNVHLGLRSETNVADVFAIHRFDEHSFHADSLDLISDSTFLNDFGQIYKYYKATTFAKFLVIGPHLYMVFRVGKSVADIKSFKWQINGDSLTYLGNRSDHEVVFPAQHEFEWTRTHRDLHRAGKHPHVSVEDRVFVETVGGDLTIKIEDNTDDGEGIYCEEVEYKDQTLDDAEIFYASVGNLILLKIRPYQEKNFRYFVFNDKIKTAMRLDAIEHACVLLPEDHGLIFSNGYYLQTGECKTFESGLTDLLFEKRMPSPNGEDYLYVFYNRETGDYVLLSYNMIEQRVDSPIACNGFSCFEDGTMAFFRSDGSTQKHHALQIWQTPYVSSEFETPANKSSYLYKIGNRDIVRAMAEAYEIINLIEKDDSYANLYVDIVKKTTDVLDTYFWLADENAFDLAATLDDIKKAATAAVNEFDRVVRVRRNTKEQFGKVSDQVNEIVSSAGTRMYQQIDDFVRSLADLRRIRGEVISLKELKYVDVDAIDRLEEQIVENNDRISHRCVEFMLRDDALAPYIERVETQRAEIDTLEKVTEAEKLNEQISNGSAELEMLIDIVSNLKIDDATQRTRIIDNISAIYSKLNQARAALKKKSQELLSVEGIAEFNSQIKLLSQAVVNYLDVCDTPDRCDEYLTKMMVQIEELEGRFAEFDEFILQLTEKREEIYTAFDTRKLSLVEARNKRATSLMSAAERILKGISTRVGNLETVADINSYFASDLMIDKVRDLIEELKALDDAVKVDDIQSRLKTIREDSVRQLKDRQELFVDGENVIRLGKHKFSVNVQELDLTMVQKEGEMFYHLTGTNFMEAVTDETFLATQPVWSQEVVSENRDVYRGEYLAYQLFQSMRKGNVPTPDDFLEMTPAQRVEQVQKFMGPRYSEGYVKGVQDHDAALILTALLEIGRDIGLLRYHVDSRALGNLFWHQYHDQTKRGRLLAKIKGMGTLSQFFPNADGRDQYVSEIHGLIQEFLAGKEVLDPLLCLQAAEFLFDQLSHHEKFSVSQGAVNLCRAFLVQLDRRNFTEKFQQSIDAIHGDAMGEFALLRDWLRAYCKEFPNDNQSEYVNEAASVLLDGSLEDRHHLSGETTLELKGMLGNHPLTDGEHYSFDYNHYLIKLQQFESDIVPAFESYTRLKKTLTDATRDAMRLDEFKPRVLTSFVRNKLIDQVYLPMVGDNFAKQIGVVGDQKRTDLMGLLLLVSPPGYGKTTLMEYIANRLGITFMKINGPAIGHHVTSLDPVEAPNASAREEIEKLNLSLEMGDNVMIYLDDIQHCNPELLQKFISLCDGSRRIEGVYKGKTRTYDLRGRKVAVVMAGNPYTESGEKFQIPDMLSNRADTYNLGDVIGDNSDAFDLSYVENCLTSNSALSILHSRSRDDIYAFIKMAEQDSQQGIVLEGNYSVEEINELVSIMKKLLRVRDVLLKVNQLYIESAAQADEFRTEPAFKLQGSYRDMNKIAEKVVAIMNDEELETLIQSHFENQAQTLTTGAEANLLKFSELMGNLEGEDLERWEDIKRTYKRNVMLGGAGADDKFGQVIGQLTVFSEGLADIRKTLTLGVDQLAGQQEASASLALTPAQQLTTQLISAGVEQLTQFNQTLDSIQSTLSTGVGRIADQPSGTSADVATAAPQKIEVVNKIPRAFLDVIKTQFEIMQNWMKPLIEMTQNTSADANQLRGAIESAVGKYNELVDRLDESASAVKKSRSKKQ